MQQSPYSLPIDIRSHDCRWGNMWAVQAAWVKRGFRLISALWVACMVLPSGRMTWGAFLIVCVLIHGVFTLIWFCVAPVLAIPYCSRLVGGLLLHVFFSLAKIR